MTENEEFIYESLIMQVRMGFFSIEEITENVLEEVEDNGFEDEISEEWVQERLDSEYKKYVEESRSWSKPTDTEKLIAAFDELCKQNIIALHNAGYEMSDGEYEVVEVERELRKKGIESDGYCFYHEQDLARAVIGEKPDLYVAFQKIDNKDAKVAISVGKKVCEVLNNFGLKTVWNGEVTTRIQIPDFRWQRVYNDEDRDLLDYEEVVNLMISNS